MHRIVWMVVGLVLALGCEDIGVGKAPARLADVAQSLDFGEAYVGAERVQTVRLEATGSAPVALEAVTVEAADGSPFALAGTPPAQVSPGTPVDLAVAYAPAAVGRHEAVLRLRTGAENLPETTVALTGRALEPLSCDDRNPCTEDAFDPQAGACDYAPLTGACDDGSDCTVEDTCREGQCVGRARDCDDGNACTRDLCDAATGCVHLDDSARCDDGNPCTADTCDPEAGCDSTNRPNGSPCPGAWRPCVEASVCLFGSCTEVPIPDGVPCDDGQVCTGDDVCEEGRCVGTPLEHPAELLGTAPFFGEDGFDPLPMGEGRWLYADCGGKGACWEVCSCGGPVRLTLVEAGEEALTVLERAEVDVGTWSRLVPAAPGVARIVAEGDATWLVDTRSGAPVAFALPHAPCGADVGRPEATVWDRQAWLLNGEDVCVYDVTDPAAPVFVSRFTVGGGSPIADWLSTPRHVWLGTASRTAVYDPSSGTPQVAALLSSVAADPVATAQGQTGFTSVLVHDAAAGRVWASMDQGLTLFDESAGAPVEVARRAELVGRLRLARRALAVGDANGTRLVDPGTLADVTIDSEPAPELHTMQLVDAGGDLVVLSWHGSLQVRALPDPARPTLVQAAGNGIASLRPYVEGSVLVNDPCRPARWDAGSVARIGHPELCAPERLVRNLDGVLALDLPYPSQVRSYDLGDPARPEAASWASWKTGVALVSTWPISLPATWAGAPDYDPTGLAWMDVSDPAAPELLGVLPDGAWETTPSVYASDGWSLLALEPTDDGPLLARRPLVAPTFTEPPKLGARSELLLSENPACVAALGNLDPLGRQWAIRLNHPEDPDELLVIDARDPSRLRVAARGLPDGNGILRGDRMVHKAVGGGLRVYGWTPENPDVVASGELTVRGEVVEFDGRIAVVARDGALSFVDTWSDPPTLVDTLDLGREVRDVTLHRSVLAVSTSQGLTTVRPACPGP